MVTKTMQVLDNVRSTTEAQEVIASLLSTDSVDSCSSSYRLPASSSLNSACSSSWSDIFDPSFLPPHELPPQMLVPEHGRLQPSIKQTIAVLADAFRGGSTTGIDRVSIRQASFMEATSASGVQDLPLEQRKENKNRGEQDEKS